MLDSFAGAAVGVGVGSGIEVAVGAGSVAGAVRVSVVEFPPELLHPTTSNKATSNSNNLFMLGV